MTKKYTVFGLIIALVISIAAVGCSSKTSEHKSTPTPTTAASTPTTEPTATPTAAPNEAATATSLDFTARVTTQGVVYTYRYRARSIGTSSLDLRIDMSSQQMNVVYIVRGSTRQFWLYSGGQWLEMSQSFDQYWSTWNESFAGYRTALAAEWTGLQDWTYTVSGVTVTYTGITINPALPDSLFQPN